MPTLIAISSYKKWDACSVLLDSLIKHNYTEGNEIVLCDDNNNNPDKHGTCGSDVFKKYKKLIPNLVLAYGKNGGVSICKNRGIKYFLEKSKADRLVLSDDDLEVLKPGLLEHLEEISQKEGERHIHLKWNDADPDLKNNRISASLLGLKNRGWDKDFPTKGYTDDLTFHAGCQGIFLWFTREIIEKIGYFPAMPSKYGAEHAVYSAQAQMAQGKSPELFAQLRHSYKWILGQNIANDYEVDMEKVRLNLAYHDQLIHKIKNREYLFNGLSGLSKKQERIIK